MSLCLFILSIISSIPSAQGYHWDGNVMYDLEYQGSSFDSEASSWTSTTNLVTSGVKTTQCGSNTVLGGYNIQISSGGGYWTRIYSGLPSHNTIYFKGIFYMIDQWVTNDDHFHLYFDNSDTIMWWIYSNYNYATINQWGNPSYNDLDPMVIYFTVPHTSGSLTFRMGNHFAKTSDRQSVGFRDITMTFATESTVPSFSYCGVTGGWPLDSNVCGCGSGTTMSPANSGICTGCHSSCLTCNGAGSSACTSCASNQYLLNGQCGTCHSSCLTCNGGARTTCTTCGGGLVLAQGACCHSSCASCSNTGSANCLSCADGKFLTSGGTCNACHASCLTCSGSLRTSCNSCLSPLVLVSGTCCDPSCATCSGTLSTNCASCAAGKYLTGGGVCNACDSSCLTCNGAGRAACTSCVSSLVKVGSTCCHTSCATCTGISSTSCSSCANGKYLTSGGACSSCDSSCLTCNGAGRTACTSCQSPLVQVGSTCCHTSCATCNGISSSSCSSCAAGKYLTSGGVCSACDSSCLTCNGGTRTTCLSCQSPLVLVGSTCCNPSCATCTGTSSSNCASCAAGKYLSGGSCNSCDSSCLTCSGSTRTTCSSCQSPLILIGTTCCHSSCAACSGTSSTSCTSCPNGSYLSGGACSPCDSSCLTCNGAGRAACTSCVASLVKVGSTCCHTSCATCTGTTSTSCSSCANGKYLTSGGACSSCDSSCLTCNGAGRTACTSCQSPLVQVGSTCCDPSCTTCSGTVSSSCSSCANGKYLTSGNSCSSCDSSCLTCNGGTRTACASCNSPLVLASGACCHTSCVTCSGTGSSNCLSCANGKYLTSGGACSSCDSSCLTCNGGTRTSCASCQSPLVLVGSTCCDPSCATCSGTGSFSCTSCVNGKYLASGGTCNSCDSSCLTCSGGTRTTCTSCQSPLVQIGSTCCDPSCATCSGTGSSNCLSCANGRYLSNGQCLACDSSCLTCSGAGRTVCTSCVSSLYLLNGICCHPWCATCSGIGSSDCLSCATGKYLASSGACNSCDSSCRSCSGPGRTACASCNSPLVLIGSTCCDPSCATCSGTSSTGCLACANGKYLTSGGSCSSCDSSCLTCNGGTRTACTSCQSSLVLVSTSCCHPSCVTCTGIGSNNCASCANGKYLTSGGACSSCDSSCLTCNSAGPTGCLTCPTNNYLSGTSCFDSCDSPLVKSSSGGIDYCDTPCTGQYAYIEGGCGSCPLPRKKVKMNGYDVCGTPCTDISTYYYWNGSCLATCPYPLDRTVDVTTGAKFCTNPCGTSTDYLFSNHTCLSTCPSPLSAIEDPGVQYCRTPCNSVSFLYENKTCIGNCLLPFVKRFEPFAQFCDRPCDPGIFWFRNTSCLANCPAPYVQITYSGVLQCLPPCKDSEYFYEFEKICNPKCESPFSTKSFEVIKICYNEIPISLAETTNVQNAAAGMQSQGDMASGGMKAAGAMNSGSPSSALLAGLSSMLQYIRYMRINYPPKVQMLFLVSAGSPISLGFDFDIPESVAKKLDDNKLADVFEKYDINSNFVNNLWDFLMTLLIVMMVIGVLSGIKFMVPEKRYPRISLILSKILGVIRWNVPIMIVCSSSGDIFFYASLQIQSSSLNSFAAIICLIVSLVMMIVVLAILMIGLKILKNWKREANNPNWSDKWRGYEILYEEYEEKSVWSLSYMILFIVRGIIFNLTLANLYRFPLIQCIIINVSNVLMFSYLLYLRPLKNFLNLVQLFVNEGLVNIIGVSIIILAIMDKAGINGQSTRVSVGDAIYFVIKVFNTFGLVFMGLGLLLFLISLYKSWRRMKAQKINSPMKIFKAMVLGEVAKQDPNPLEGHEIFKRARIRKPPRKHSMPMTNQTNEVIYIEEAEMSGAQMVTDISRSDLFSGIPGFSPNRPALRAEEDVSDLQITELDIQQSDELTRWQENSRAQMMNFGSEIEEATATEERISPNMRDHHKHRNRKILKNRMKSTAEKPQVINKEEVETEKTEIKATEIVENSRRKNLGLGGFLKSLGERIKGRPKSREPSQNQKLSAENSRKTETKEKEEVMEERIETGGAPDLKMTEGDDVKSGFIQNWGRLKGRMRSRRALNISSSEEQVAEIKEKALEERVETGVSEVEITENPQKMAKIKSVEFIQNWGRLKGRMKARESTSISLHPEENSEKIEKTEKEVRKETETANIEITKLMEELQEKKKTAQDLRNGKGRIARRQQRNLNPHEGEKLQIKKDEVLEERIETGTAEIMKDSQNDKKNSGFIQDWGNLKGRLSPTKNVIDEKESPSLFKDFPKLKSRLRKTQK